MISPVVRLTYSSRPRALSSSHSAAVRRSCQTIALCTGSPVARSQTTTVSRWLVTPMAAMSSAPHSVWASTCLATVTWVFQMSSGLCSTQPGRG